MYQSFVGGYDKITIAKNDLLLLFPFMLRSLFYACTLFAAILFILWYFYFIIYILILHILPGLPPVPLPVYNGNLLLKDAA